MTLDTDNAKLFFKLFLPMLDYVNLKCHVLENDEKLKTLQTAKTVKKENTLTQALADMLIDKVYVYPDNRLEIEWKIKDFCTDTTVMLS